MVITVVLGSLRVWTHIQYLYLSTEKFSMLAFKKAMAIKWDTKYSSGWCILLHKVHNPNDFKADYWWSNLQGKYNNVTLSPCLYWSYSRSRFLSKIAHRSCIFMSCKGHLCSPADYVTAISLWLKDLYLVQKREKLPMIILFTCCLPPPISL